MEPWHWQTLNIHTHEMYLHEGRNHTVEKWTNLLCGIIKYSSELRMYEIGAQRARDGLF